MRIRVKHTAADFMAVVTDFQSVTREKVYMSLLHAFES